MGSDGSCRIRSISEKIAPRSNFQERFLIFPLVQFRLATSHPSSLFGMQSTLRKHVPSGLNSVYVLVGVRFLILDMQVWFWDDDNNDSDEEASRRFIMQF